MDNQANALAMLGRPGEAEAVCREALDKDPDHCGSYVVLGGLLEASGHFTDAEGAYRTALRLREISPESWNNLGNLLRAQGRYVEAIEAFRTAIDLQPTNAMAHSNLVFSRALDPDMTGEMLLTEAQNWYQVHAAEPIGHEPSRATPHLNKPDKTRRLRVGYVSPDFRDHAVGTFLQPLIAAHDHAKIEIFAFGDVARPDQQTDWFEQNVGHWRNSFGWADTRLVQKIRDDRIDVLIDVTGHTGGNRLVSLAERPAPVQASWLGYGGSTGVDGIGWHITNAYTDPDSSAAHYSERLIRLSQCLFCYSPDSAAPPIGPLPADGAGHVTFGSFNNMSKVNDRAVACWAKVMARVPKSRLVLKGQGFDDAGFRDQFLKNLQPLTSRLTGLIWSAISRVNLRIYRPSGQLIWCSTPSLIRERQRLARRYGWAFPS